MPEESLEKEIQEAAYNGSKQALSEQPEVEIPSEMEVTVKNWPEEKERPEIEKVEVTNFSEIKLPEPKVTVNVPEQEPPIVNVEKTDLTELAEMLRKQSDLLNRIAEKETPNFPIEEFERIAKENNSKYKGGGIGPNKIFQRRASDGEVINPMSQDELANLNSTTTALNDGENFTGTWEKFSGWTGIKIAVATDQDGYFEIQYSTDGTNVDSTLTRYYRTGQINPPHKFENMRAWFRVRFFNNSGSNQTYLRLQTHKTNSAGLLNIPIDATVSQNYDAIIVRPTDPEYEAALGRRQGILIWNKFGDDVNLDTADGEQTIWGAGETLSPLTSAETFTITYDGTGGGSTDGAGTNGARVLTFYYLDSNRVQQIATHTLGTDGSDVTSFSGLGINRVQVTTAGTGLTNASDITITATTAGSAQAFIPAGIGITEQCFFFTQNNAQFLTDWLWFNVNKLTGGNPKVTVRAYVRDFDLGVRYRVFRHVIDSATENTVELNPPHPFTVPDNSLLEFTAQTDVNDTVVELRFSGAEYRDVDA